MSQVKELLKKNQEWAKSCIQEDPYFFKELAKVQKPDYLWIGCSDARVPANTILGLPYGAVFVHRNVANLVNHSDFNCLSVIQFAVDFLKVKDIIVCGHYGCGGIRGALSGKSMGLIDHWLWHIKNIYNLHKHELEKIKNINQKAKRLCELNVQEQVMHLCDTSVVQDAWKRKQALSVHGWVYDIHDGLVRDLNLSVSNVKEYRKKIAKKL